MKSLIWAGAAAMACSTLAVADMLDFEDAPTPIVWTGPPIIGAYGATTNYAGFTWGGTPDGAYFFSGPFGLNTGYSYGTTGFRALFSADDPTTSTGSTLPIIMRRNSPWTFVGADFTGAYNQDLMVDITGYDALGNIVNSTTITLGLPIGPDVRTFAGFVNIAELRIHSYGGTDYGHLPPGSVYFGTNLVIDNLIFTPAPAGLALLGVMGALPRRRRPA
ncbi:MAG: hypothetical protein FJW21_14150 [Acidimicrobiia bacterium]|nr:hypothetical protein [Acidimicrobiia bacterium]